MAVYTDGFEWRIAMSMDDLRRQVVVEDAMYSDDDFDEAGYKVCDPADSLTIILDPYGPEDEWERVTKTMAEWEDEKGRGFLGSTEW